MFLKFVIVLVTVALASGLRLNMKFAIPSANKVASAAMAGMFALTSIGGPVSAITSEQLGSLSYEQVKGSGLANRCVTVDGVPGASIAAGKKLKVTDLCLEPKSWQVEEETSKKGVSKKEFVNTKLMTRQTYTLYGISGSLDGNKFTEEDGIDYAATTVQLPGGERVPFLFTVKDLVATTSGGPVKEGYSMSGSFTVPSYRTGLFLDPKGRGTTTGYDFAGALPGLQNSVEGDAELFKENNKKFDVLKGDIELQVSAVNGDEVAGVFVSKQPSDTDMGAKVPKTILLKGIWSAKIE